MTAKKTKKTLKDIRDRPLTDSQATFVTAFEEGLEKGSKKAAQEKKE